MEVVPSEAGGDKHQQLTLFPIDHYFTAYWRARGKDRPIAADLAGLPAIFPDIGPAAALVREITGAEEPRFAILMTDYFGGAGDQWAVVLEGSRLLSPPQASINQALALLGLTRAAAHDEFETFGLDNFRHNPEYLERYIELCDELGV